MIYRIAYASAASGSMSETGISDILTTARAKNEKAGLTGLLLFHDGNFFQVLEGDRDEVERCLHRITADPRHGRLTMLIQSESDHRIFPNWSMGYAQPDRLPQEHRDIIVSLSALASQADHASKEQEIEIETLTRAFLQTFREFS